MRRIGAVLAGLLLTAACASETSQDPGSTADGSSSETTTYLPVDPEFRPGELTRGKVTVDDTSIEYMSIVPEGFSAGDVAPVLLALPPGAQDIGQASSTLAGVYETEALARGWVVVSPAAPNGELFFDGSERFLPGFIDFVESWATPEGDGIHVSGISNGGISSFRVATQHPDRFRSITVFPGYPISDADVGAVDTLAGIPVNLFVGERDTTWVGPMQATAERLDDLGGDVTYEVFPDEGHIIGALSDGVRIFDELDAAR